MEKINKQKGITLIALIITIIVLLILAGVTISTLSGNNSATQKAAEAEEKNAIGQAKEEIEMGAMDALLNYYTYGTSSVGTSKQIIIEQKATDTLENIKNIEKNILSTSNVNTEDHTIIINTRSLSVTGVIEDNGTITWTEATNNSGNSETRKGGGNESIAVNTMRGMIGKTVNYTGYSATYNGGWRLFYADNDDAYLISTATIDSTTLFGGTKTIPLSDKSTTTVMDSGTYGGKWNSLWLSYHVGNTTAVTNQSRHQAISYLCDPLNWTSFVAEKAPTGTYAVGAPTLELFLSSWNLRLDESNSITPVTATVNEVGYDDVISSGIYATVKAADGSEQLYNNGYNYWLASTDNTTYNYVEDYRRHVLGVSSKIEYYLYNNNNNIGIRPIVVIPRDKLKESADGTTLDVIMNTAQ